MGVFDGQPVDAANTNPAFLDANSDDTALGKLTLGNTEAVSGSTVTNIQTEHNSAASFMGKALNSVKNDLPVYTNNQVGSVNDPLRTRADAISQKFNAVGGHTHTGASGDAPPIVASTLASVPYRGFVREGVNKSVPNGSSSVVVTSDFATQTAGGSAVVLGVVTDPPYNQVIIRYASGANQGDQILDSLGNTVYARLTFAASVWTLSFFVNLSGVETAYTFTATTLIAYYYQEIFNPMVNPPTYSEFAVVPSENATADIITATTTLQGKVSLGTSAQPVGSANSAGTANAQVANQDHVHQGVHSVSKSGSSQLYNDVTLTGSGGSSLTQAAQNIDFYSVPLTSSAAQSVGASNTVGVGTSSARDDHAHQGVHSVAKNGSSQLYGDVTLSATGGASLSQVGQDIAINAPALASTAAQSVTSANAAGVGTESARVDHAHQGVHSIAKSGSAQLFSDVTLTGTGGTSLTQLAQDIAIDSPALSSTAPNDVGSAAAIGTGTTSARADHTHRGVTSISKNGSAAMYGQITFSQGANITITQTAGDLSIASSGGGGGGGALQWHVDTTASFGDPGAIELTDPYLGTRTFQFIPSSFAQIKTLVKVPSSYVAGTQIFLRAPIYTAASGNHAVVLTTYLIRPLTDNITSIANLQTASLTTSIATAFRVNLLSLQATNGSGQINSVAVSANDYLMFTFLVSGANPSDVFLLGSATEVQFT